MSIPIPIEFGYYYSVKQIGEVTCECCVCHASWNCLVEEWRRRFHILYIPARTVARGYLFTWSECKHSLDINDSFAVQQYEENCNMQGILVAPDCQILVPLKIVKPIPVTPLGWLLLFPLILLACGLLSFLILGVLLIIDSMF